MCCPVWGQCPTFSGHTNVLPCVRLMPHIDGAVQHKHTVCTAKCGVNALYCWHCLGPTYVLSNLGSMPHIATAVQDMHKYCQVWGQCPHIAKAVQGVHVHCYMWGLCLILMQLFRIFICTAKCGDNAPHCNSFSRHNLIKHELQKRVPMPHIATAAQDIQRNVG